MSSISNTNTAYVEGECGDDDCGHWIWTRVDKTDPLGVYARCGVCGHIRWFGDYKPLYQLEGPDGEWAGEGVPEKPEVSHEQD